MEKMYQSYKDIAEFYIVYIREAHATDSSWPVGYAKDLGIKQHTSFGERCEVAEKLVKAKKLTIPFLVDNMKNEAGEAYHGWPDRVFLIRKDGKLGVAGRRGPWGFKPALDDAEAWLATYKKTGKEPDLPAPGAEKIDVAEMQMELGMAYRNEDYEKALGIGEKILKARPRDVNTLYNVACLHCLLGHKDKAYASLEKAIDAGYRDADHMVDDADFKTIRAEDRFRALVRRLRAEREDADRASEAAGGFGAAIGEWEMKTTLRGNQIEATMTISEKDGRLGGTWKSRGREMKLIDLKLDGRKLSFKRRMGPEMELAFAGTISGDRIEGTYTGPFGDLTSNGERRRSGDDAKTTTDEKKRKRSAKAEKNTFRGLLGPDSQKVRQSGGKTLLWAAGNPQSADAEWYDFTGSPIPAEKLQFGIGRDRIRAIDDPLFVAPDDKRLLRLPRSPYRREEKATTTDDLMVIGYADGSDARAYPTALLDHHELVNDRIGGKPLTVGW